MHEVGGWVLPDADKYFERFIPKDGPLPKRNGFQREHLEEAFKHVNKFHVALDIGAHVGFWTRDMAKAFDKVLAFEAATDTFCCLIANTSDMINVRCRHAAIGATSGRARIHVDPKREAEGNTGSRYVKADQGGEVEMITVDSLGLSRCDFMKIDVEGFEHAVLKGAATTLRRFQPTIIMECDKKFEKRYGEQPHAAELFLTYRGYKEVAHMRPDKVFVYAQPVQ